MFHVSLDTNILRDDPQRRGAPFRRLEELVQDGHVQLHLPEIVCREFTTGVAAEYRQHLNSGIRELNSVRRDFIDPIASDLSSHLRELRKNIEDRCEADFKEWIAKTKAVQYSPPPEALPWLVDAYFAGHLPFRAAKNRNDFPDALIWTTITYIADQVGELHFVSRDTGLSAAAKDAASIIHYPSIEDFLVSTFGELATLTDERLLGLLHEAVKELETRAIELVPEHIQGETVRSKYIPDDNHEATISLAYEPSELKIDVTRTENLGGGYFTFEFVGRADVTLDYAVYKADWAVLDDDRISEIGISELNDHYYGAEESAEVSFRGYLDVRVTYNEPDEDEYLSNADLKELISRAEYDVPELEVTKLHMPYPEY